MGLSTLSTARLELRPCEPSDLDALLPIWRNPRVRRYLFDDVEVSCEAARSLLTDWTADLEAGLGLWVIAARGRPERVLGCVGLARVEEAARFDRDLEGEIEPLIALAPEHWGAGYGAEALRAAVDYAFVSLRLRRLVAVTDVPNEASDRLLRRVGFEPRAECDGPRHRLRTYRLVAP